MDRYRQKLNTRQILQEMTVRLHSLCVATLFLATIFHSGWASAYGDNYRPFEISLFSPAHIFHPDNKVITGHSFNVFYGRTKSVYGTELGIGVNREDGDVIGLQVAGILNLVNGSVYGIQLSGAANVAGACYGLCLSGGSNYYKKGGAGISIGLYQHVEGSYDGIQLSVFGVSTTSYDLLANRFTHHGLAVTAGVNAAPSFAGLQLATFNFVFHDFYGAQIGLWNSNNSFSKLLSSKVTSHSMYRTQYEDTYSVTRNERGKMKGIQIAFLVNSAANVYGLQMGGIVNTATGEVIGVQISGTMNVANGDMTGVQISAINIAEDCTGIQIGMVNVCRNLKGLQIGAFNIAYENRLPFMVGINAGF